MLKISSFTSDDNIISQLFFGSMKEIMTFNNQNNIVKYLFQFLNKYIPLEN